MSSSPHSSQAQGESGVLSGTCLSNEDPREVWGGNISDQVEGPIVTETYFCEAG